MKKLMLLIAAGSLWLFLAAVPTFADGGPHVVATNSGASTLTADSCAGCHRAHTAKGEYLIKAVSEELLCESCHGAGATGASTNVWGGVQYDLTGTTRNAVIGALRGGGFETTQMGGNGRLQVGTSNKSKVTVDMGTPHATTSAHIDVSGTNALAQPHVLWGNGAASSSASVGPSVSLGCTDCHNPHGNGQYRILNPIPKPTGATNPVARNILATVDAMDIIVTKSAHSFYPGDLVDISGATGIANGTYQVVAVPNGVTLQVGAFVAVDSTNTAGYTVTPITADGTVGTISESNAVVADSPLGNYNYASGTSDTKNYTVIQKDGAQGTTASYLLYANQLGAYANTTGDYWHRQVPWNGNAPGGRVVSVVSGTITTLSSHLLSVGMRITLTNTSLGASATETTVVSTPSATTFTVTVAPSDGTWSTSATTYPALAIVSARKITDVAAGGVFTTQYAHGFVVGSIITINGAAAAQPTNVTGLQNGNYQVATVPTTSTFTLTSASLNSQTPTVAAYSTSTGNLPTATMVYSQDDAPNGRPATNPTNAIGQVAFNVQITSWCSACHTRYMSNSNPNPGTTAAPEAGSSAESAKTLSGLTAGTGVFASASSFGYAWGDVVTFDIATTGGAAHSTSPALSGNYRVVFVAADGKTIKVSATTGGAAITFTTVTTAPTKVIRVGPVAASSWWFPRQTDTAGQLDASFQYQHRTIPNRACTTCHVAHGTSVAMNGTYTSTFTWPDPAIVTSLNNSRLLKIDNRGTCQSCHDPTSTWSLAYPDKYAGDVDGVTGGSWSGTPSYNTGGTPVLP